MSFRLRRGTDTERQSVVFAEGELVYTTDSKELYVGDGITLGGIRITGETSVSPIALTQNLDLNSFDIVGSGDIDISGQVTANSFYGNGSGLTNLPALDVNNGATYQISIMGADSSILVNSGTSELFGTFIGNLNGALFDSNNNIMIDNVLRTMSGTLNGEFNGTSNGEFNGTSSGLFVGDDSSVMVDGANSTFYGKFSGDASALTNFPPDIGITEGASYNINVVGGDVFTDNSSLIIDGQTGYVHTSRIIANDASSVSVEQPGLNLSTQFNVVSNNRRSFIKLTNKNREVDLSVPNSLYGALLFNRDDINGQSTAGSILGGNDFIGLTCNDGSNTYPDSNFLMIKSNGRFGFGTYTPSAKVDVQGDILATGSITPGVYANATARDAEITVPAAGMMVFNSALQKFQGYVSDTGLAEDGASNATPGWINLN